LTQEFTPIEKIIRKLNRSLARSSFVPSSLRVLALRKAGVRIGDEVIINEGFTLACDIGHEPNLTIEDRVAFGPNVTVVMTSHPNNSRLRALRYRYPSFETFGIVTIKHDVWIGAGAIILPNVTLGECSIIGAGAVVTRDVAPYCMVVGVPAKAIRIIDVREGTI